MKSPDANVLLYAIDPSSPRHSSAREWLERALSGTEPIGFTWVVLLAVLRLSTNPALFDPPLGATTALDLIDDWLARPVATTIDPTERHAAVMRALLEPAGTAGNLTTDAHLAALAIEHGATLATFDGDFHRFTGLKLEHLR